MFLKINLADSNKADYFITFVKKNHMLKRTFALVTLGLFTCQATFAQKAITLQQNFQPGKKYGYAMSYDQNIGQNIMGQDLTMKQIMKIDYSFDISTATAPDKNVKVTYNKIYSLSDAMGASTEYDSEKDNGTENNPLSALKGASFNMVITPKGTVKSVSGVEKMLNDMAEKSSKDSSTISKIKEALNKQFGPEAIKASMEAALKIYPEKPVKPGESWIVETELKNILPIKMKTTYTLKEVKENKAYVSVTGILNAVGPVEIMGFTMQTNLNGNNNGDMVIDVKSGLALDSDMKIIIGGTMTAMGQEIKMKIDGQNKINGKEL